MKSIQRMYSVLDVEASRNPYRRSGIRPLLSGASGGALAAVLAASAAGCTSARPDLPFDDLCSSPGSGEYEFEAVSTPMGSFEPTTVGTSALDGVSAGALIVDDDDLNDDYSIYLKGLEEYEKLKGTYAASLAIYEAIDPEKDTEEWTMEETQAEEQFKLFAAEMDVICARYSALHTAGKSTAPTFVDCKDRYDENGDGVIGLFDLSVRPEGSQDRELAACTTLTGVPNTHALTFWGPVSTRRTGLDDIEAPRDGSNFSGITVPLVIAPYQATVDVSEWEGIAFFARQAITEEAIALDSPLLIAKPPERKPVSASAGPQDGVSQLGVVIQTIDTASADEGLGAKRYTADQMCPGLGEDGKVDSMAEEVSCFASQKDFDDFPGPALTGELNGAPFTYKWAMTGEDGRPADIPQPFCIDYSPVDATPGKETPYRNQCWDGFRTMVEVGRTWKYYFIPFEHMRQAGWGQVAPSFRTNHVKSINFLASAFQPTNVVVDEVAFYRRRR